MREIPEHLIELRNYATGLQKVPLGCNNTINVDPEIVAVAQILTYAHWLERGYSQYTAEIAALESWRSYLHHAIALTPFLTRLKIEARQNPSAVSETNEELHGSL